ncbi:10646_t:CDS:2, partial [Scutellospora calospora]
ISSEELNQIWNNQEELDDKNNLDLFLSENNNESELDKEKLLARSNRIKLMVTLLDPRLKEIE